MSLKKLGLAAALSLASVTAQAAAPVGSFGNVPALFNGLGKIANPVLQPLLGGAVAPVVGNIVAAAAEPAFTLVGGLLIGPTNLLLPQNPIARPDGARGLLPALPGLQ